MLALCVATSSLVGCGTTRSTAIAGGTLAAVGGGLIVHAAASDCSDHPDGQVPCQIGTGAEGGVGIAIAALGVAMLVLAAKHARRDRE
jgi:hypothetical protein